MNDPVVARAADRRTVGAGASLATASQVVVAVGGGVLSVIVARVLGPGDTGGFTLLTSAVLILTVIAMWGLETGLSYYVAAGSWAIRRALWQTQLVALTSGIAVAAVAFGLSVLLDDSAFRGISRTEAALGFAALPFAVSWTLTIFLATAEQRYEASALIQGGQSIGSVAMTAALAPPFGLAGALAAVMAAHGAVAFLGLVGAARRHGRPTAGLLTCAGEELRRASTFGRGLQGATLLQFVNQRADLFVLNAVAARDAVGHYAVALAVTALAFLAPRALSSVILPRVAALDADVSRRGERDMVIGKAVRQTALLVAGAGALIAVGLLLVPLVYGSEFAESVALGFILLPGAACLAIAQILGTLVVALGSTSPVLRIAMAVTPLTLALYVLLIPTWKAPGAALASTLSYAMTCAATTVAFRRAWPSASWRELRPTRDDLRDYVLLVGRAAARLRSRSTAS